MAEEQIEYRIRQLDGREMFLISAEVMDSDDTKRVRAIKAEREMLQKRLEEFDEERN